MSLPKPCAKCGKPGTANGLCAEHDKKLSNPAYRDKQYVANRRQLIEMTWKLGLVCWKCGYPFMSKKDITADHKIPLRDGGSHELDNLAPAHDKCNKSWRPKKKDAPAVIPDPHIQRNDYLEW